MAKPDWGALQHQFLAEHAKTGVSPKDWCAAQGLNYSSAKRYIKVTTYGANSQKKSANKSANSQKEKGGSSKKGKVIKNQPDTGARSKSPETKPIRGSRTAPPAPPAWAMMPPSNSLQLLDETFSVSEPESSATKQP